MGQSRLSVIGLALARYAPNAVDARKPAIKRVCLMAVPLTMWAERSTAGNVAAPPRIRGALRFTVARSPYRTLVSIGTTEFTGNFRANVELGWIIVVNEAPRRLARPQNVRDSDADLAALPLPIMTLFYNTNGLGYEV
jgi:hypothetical protein